MTTLSSLDELKLAKLRQLRQLQGLKAERDRKAKEEVVRREADRLRTVDVFAAVGYTPTPKQQAFHDATAFDLLFGGSLGGGKVVP